jgi:hypothetical protein
MPVHDAEARRDTAAFARRYFAGTITLDTFLRCSAGSGDPLIQALREAVVHEPLRDGFFGLRERWWQSRYWQPVERLLGELDKGSAGEAPAERIYPRISPWSLVFGAVFLLWAGLFAARHLDQLLTDVSRGASISLWNGLTVGTLGVLTATGLQGWIYRLRLYRTRKIQTGDGDPGRF